MKLAVKDLARKSICDGHLFITSKEGRKFYLMQPGMLVDKDFIKKYAQTNTVFDFEPLTNPEITELFSSLLKELRYLQFEKDLKEKSAEIVAKFQEIFSKEEHFLNFAMVCFQEFCQLPEESITKIHSFDMHLFRKALYSSAFAVVIALSNDIYQFTMLRDFYNLTFALDIGLCDANYSYYVAKACNKENQAPGAGLNWMKSEKASPAEMEVFLNHPRKSYDYFKTSDFLAYPELAEIVLFQHELSDGSGFPRGVFKNEVSSWEAVVVLADSMVEIEDEFPFEKNVIEHILNFNNAKVGDLPISRVHGKLCKALSYFERLKETGS